MIGPSTTRFHVELIKPSHYDDDGYVVQWPKAWIPSTSLVSLFALTRQVTRDKILVNAYDETNTRIPVEKIVRRIREAGGNGILCMVGVQSNQYPRAMDLARRFREAGGPGGHRRLSRQRLHRHASGDAGRPEGGTESGHLPDAAAGLRRPQTPPLRAAGAGIGRGARGADAKGGFRVGCA